MASIIDILKAKRDLLNESLTSVVDEKAYDLIQNDIQQLTKTIILEENREKIRIEQEKARKRKEAIADHNARMKKVDKLKKTAADEDVALFEKIGEIYDTYSQRFDKAVEIAEVTESLQHSARELDLEIPESEQITICHMPNPIGTKEAFFVELLNQYNMAYGQLKDAKKNNIVGAPDKPGLAWYHKGSGQFFPIPDTQEVEGK